ncbi:uncharacterized protein LOC130939874 [Arachis stenosperma]|uniref:uncharacterized protein LOC130939874 n=1 Tax=Arachis stenosperma TaxID=217475 RepID=UPI0025ABF673|nr:uncharacterized protein LOC130939874 [Arachis stenosperma]
MPPLSCIAAFRTESERKRSHGGGKSGGAAVHREATVAVARSVTAAAGSCAAVTELLSPENFASSLPESDCRCRLRWLPGCRRTGSETAVISVQPLFLRFELLRLFRKWLGTEVLVAGILTVDFGSRRKELMRCLGYGICSPSKGRERECVPSRIRAKPRREIVREGAHRRPTRVQLTAVVAAPLSCAAVELVTVSPSPTSHAAAQLHRSLSNREREKEISRWREVGRRHRASRSYCRSRALRHLCCWELHRRNRASVAGKLRRSHQKTLPSSLPESDCHYRLRWLPGCRRTGSETAAISVQPLFLQFELLRLFRKWLGTEVLVAGILTVDFGSRRKELMRRLGYGICVLRMTATTTVNGNQNHLQRGGQRSSDDLEQLQWVDLEALFSDKSRKAPLEGRRVEFLHGSQGTEMSFLLEMVLGELRFERVQRLQPHQRDIESRD